MIKLRIIKNNKIKWIVEEIGSLKLGQLFPLGMAKYIFSE
jgi:hypothetical protein